MYVLRTVLLWQLDLACSSVLVFFRDGLYVPVYTGKHVVPWWHSLLYAANEKFWKTNQIEIACYCNLREMKSNEIKLAKDLIYHFSRATCMQILIQNLRSKAFLIRKRDQDSHRSQGERKAMPWLQFRGRRGHLAQGHRSQWRKAWAEPPGWQVQLQKVQQSKHEDFPI